MKKTLAYILILAAAAFSLTGCKHIYFDTETVPEAEAFPEFLVRIETHIQRIQVTPVDQAEPQPADRQFILQGKGIQPGKPFRADLLCIESIFLLIPLLAQLPVPVAGKPVITMGPDPVAGLVALRAFSHRVAEKPDFVRPDCFQFLFHGPCRDHVPVKVPQQHDFHFRHPAVLLFRLIVFFRTADYRICSMPTLYGTSPSFS